MQGYHGLVLASGLYGASLGGSLYSLKMLTLERLRARQFAKSWALVQAAEALPILLGVPLTGTLRSPPALSRVYPHKPLAKLLGLRPPDKLPGQRLPKAQRQIPRYTQELRSNFLPTRDMDRFQARRS